MLEQDPHSHLSLVILIADPIEVIVHNLVQVMLLHLHQFRKLLLLLLLLLLFGLKLTDHGSLLALEDFREEFALASKDLAHLVELVVPVIDEAWVVDTALNSKI